MVSKRRSRGISHVSFIGGIKKVSAAVKSMRKNGSTPKIELQCLLTQKNEGDMRSVEMLAREIGADRVVFKTLQAGFINDGEIFLPDNSEHTRYFIDDDGSIETDRWWYLQNRSSRFRYYWFHQTY